MKLTQIAFRHIPYKGPLTQEGLVEELNWMIKKFSDRMVKPNRFIISSASPYQEFQQFVEEHTDLKMRIVNDAGLNKEEICIDFEPEVDVNMFVFPTPPSKMEEKELIEFIQTAVNNYNERHKTPAKVCLIAGHELEQMDPGIRSEIFYKAGLQCLPLFDSQPITAMFLS